MKTLLPLFLIPVAVFAGTMDYSVTTAVGEYPERSMEPGDDHFAGIEGPFAGAKAASTFDAAYTLPTPLGSHWLLKDANVKFTGSFELSPLSVRPKIKAEFTPLPFLVFSTGGSVGSGWNPLGFNGMSIYNSEKQEYEALTPFKHYFYEFWASATFQFDTGALIEGDWSHVVFLATYECLYKGITGVDDGEIWEWQAWPGEANGWQYDLYMVLGYKMPLMVDMVGFMADFYGHYDPSDYAKKYKGFDGDFMWIDLSVFFDLKLNKNNSLTTMFTFEADRSFATDHEDVEEEPLLTRVGREWSFYRIAFSWKHEF